MHFAAGNYDAVGAIAIAGRKEDAVRRRLERMMDKMKVDEALAEEFPEYCLKEKAFKKLAKGRAEEAKRAGPCGIDFSVSGPPPGWFQGLGPLSRKQKHALFWAASWRRAAM